MTYYTIKIDEENQLVIFHGIDWGHGVGGELPLWQYSEHSGIVVVKVVGASNWSARGETSYSPAAFMVLRIMKEPLKETEDGWVQAEMITEFPIRKARSE